MAEQLIRQLQKQQKISDGTMIKYEELEMEESMNQKNENNFLNSKLRHMCPNHPNKKVNFLKIFIKFSCKISV